MGMGAGVRGKAHECSVPQKGGGNAGDCTNIGVPMKTIPYFLILSIFFILACSLTTPPTAKDTEVPSVKKIYLTTPVNDPEPISHTIPETCTVSAQSLHLRGYAGLHCSVIAWLSKGDVLVLQETAQNWIQVITPAGQTGWVHSKYCGGS